MDLIILILELNNNVKANNKKCKDQTLINLVK